MPVTVPANSIVTGIDLALGEGGSVAGTVTDEALLEERRDNLLAAVAAASAVSLGVALMFVMLQAPDVAMTEAAIGSGLTTFLFFFVLGRVRRGEHD